MQTGTQPYVPPGGAGASPASGSGSAPSGVARPARARTWLIALAAIVTELVVIAVVGNQWVSDKLVPGRSTGSLASGIRNSARTYSWRLTPRHADTIREYAGSWTIVGTTVVLSVLLIVAVVRGPVTFGRAFFGAWMAVPVATMVGGYARAFVINMTLRPGESQASRALFGTLSPGSGVFIAGFVLGLIVAIVVGSVAVVSRRPAVDAADYADSDYAGKGYAGNEYADNDNGGNYAGIAGAGAAGAGGSQPPPWQDRYYGPPPQTYGGGGAEGQDGTAQRAGETAEFPALAEDESGSTSRLPDVGAPGPQDGEAGGGDSTAVFPRLPERDQDSPAASSDRIESGEHDATAPHEIAPHENDTTQFATSGGPAQETPAPESGDQQPTEQQSGEQQSGEQQSTEQQPAEQQSGEQQSTEQQPTEQPGPREEHIATDGEQSTTRFPRPPDDEDIHPER